MKAFISTVLVSFIIPSALFVHAIPTPRGSGDRVVDRSTMTHLYEKRTADIADIDKLVIKFADVLEQLEGGFYKLALDKFNASDFEAAGFSDGDVPLQQIQIIQKDEDIHAKVLESALEAAGASPLTCQFNFDAALYDVGTMLATARVAEVIGSSAYSGSANLIQDPKVLSLAAAILAIEGSHSTVTNILSGSGAAVPSPFVVPLNASEVLALVGGFFSGPCDTGIAPNPALTITNAADLRTGAAVSLNSTAFDSSSQGNLFCQILTGNLTETIPFPLNECTIPYGVSGPTYFWVTDSSDPLPNDVIDRSTNTHVVAGPAITIIDCDPQALGIIAVEGEVPYTSTYDSYVAEASPTNYVGPYGCWFHGKSCQGTH
ncbi:hypothetical protein Agabi119p4_1014 [Agaricus bisporus var. burnettii]|uniref:Ferritin-like domain-containing protein n=1 Tax=Agaricus bisporus var. burnettii TaxID=192524 RepID=A0A8H7FBU6_AGABI|nr:hypothetical protein Agabi119p4_1014 [Agaricus bisporus var. burnettii]